MYFDWLSFSGMVALKIRFDGSKRAGIIRIRTNNAIERLNREIKRRTKAIGAFPDGQSALMLVCARLRHVVATSWGARRYMNMDHLFKSEKDLLSDIITG